MSKKRKKKAFKRLDWSEDPAASGMRDRAFVSIRGVRVELVAYRDGRWFVCVSGTYKPVRRGMSADPKREAWYAAVTYTQTQNA